MSEQKCQWCGSSLNHTFDNNAGEPVLHVFNCQTSRWHSGPWHIGNRCRERCAEQMRRLRAFRTGDVSHDTIDKYIEFRAQAVLDDAITAAVRAAVHSVTEGD